MIWSLLHCNSYMCSNTAWIIACGKCSVTQYMIKPHDLSCTTWYPLISYVYQKKTVHKKSIRLWVVFKHISLKWNRKSAKRKSIISLQIYQIEISMAGKLIVLRDTMKANSVASSTDPFSKNFLSMIHLRLISIYWN